MKRQSQRLTVRETSEILGISQNEIRFCLRKGTLPIGAARRANRGKGYRYDVYRPLVEKYIGRSLEE